MLKIKLLRINVLLICFSLFLAGLNVFAIRNAPITTFVTKSACPAQAVVMPITVAGFTNIMAVSLRIDYDPTVATFSSFVGNVNLGGMMINSVPVTSNLSKLMIVWTDVTPRSLAPTDTLVKITMNFISGSSTLVFNNTGGGGECEYADETGTAMNDIPTANYYINGAINSLAVGSTGSITGNSAVCAGANGVAYSIAAVTNATAYTWSLPSGFFVAGGYNTNSITANVSGTAISGNISVTPSNTCGPGSPSPNFAVIVNPLPVPTITGSTSVCAGVTGVTYSTESGMTGYIWTISSGGTITAGSSTNQITVSWNTPGPQTISVNYTNTNGCTAVAATVKNVTVNSLPTPTISGPSALCEGAAGNVYATQSGMSNYAWTVSPGGTITGGSGTAQVTVSWNTAGPQNVSVNYANSNGCSATTPASYTVTVNPLPSPLVFGPGAACTGSVGNLYSTATGMSNYIWSVSSGGTITSGGTPTSSSVTVTWNTSGPQFVSLNYTDPNGCTAVSPSVYNVAVSTVPVPTINGANVSCETTVSAYSTEGGMLNYIWTVSSGGTIISGQGTSSVLIQWNVTGTQTLSVIYSGGGTCNPVSPTVMNVNVNPKPATPVVTTSGDTLISNALSGNQWYFSQSGGQGNPVAGATGQKLLVLGTGYYWTIVTLTGCSSDTSNHEYMIAVGISENSQGFGELSVYPVPNSGVFTFKLQTIISGNIDIEVINDLGLTVYLEQHIPVTADFIRTIDLRPVPPGIYTLILRNEQGKAIRRIIIR